MSRLLPKLFHRQPPKKLSAVLSTSNCSYELTQDFARYLILHLPFLFFSIIDISSLLGPYSY
jgi:hypothetical protein